MLLDRMDQIQIVKLVIFWALANPLIEQMTIKINSPILKCFHLMCAGVKTCSFDDADAESCVGMVTHRE